MSSRRWSTRLERVRLEQYLQITHFLMNKEELESSSDDGDSSTASLLGDHAMRITLLYAMFINTSAVESDLITFGRRPIISDFDDASCISNFRFRNADLQRLADLLWVRLQANFDGTKEHIVVANRYKVPFETGLLLVLYRFSHPHTIHFEMEAFFGMRKSHISAAIGTFVSVLYNFAYRFLNNPAIFKPRMPVYAALIEAKIGIVNNVWGSLTGHYERYAVQHITRGYYIADTRGRMVSSFSQ